MGMKNILAVRTDRLGEFVLTIPALAALKRKYPQARLVLLVNPHLVSLAEKIPCVDQVLPWGISDHTFAQRKELTARLRGEQFDTVVIFNPSKEMNLCTFFAGIPERIGYDRKWGFLLTGRTKDEKHLGVRHEVESNLELLKLMGIYDMRVEFPLALDSQMSAAALKKHGVEAGGPYVVIHPFTSDKVKEWPQENFLALAKRIRTELGIPAVTVGSTGEYDRSSWESAGVRDLINRTSLLELAAILAKATVLVSSDSGPVHLAAALGTPVVALFRNDLAGKTPQRWGPWGSGHSIIAKPSLFEIGGDEVFAAVKARCR